MIVQSMTRFKSPLRYPGGKSRAVERMNLLLPADFDEYREPFVGGGSLFIYLKQQRPGLNVWINDLNPELYYFWKYAQIDSQELARELMVIKKQRQKGAGLPPTFAGWRWRDLYVSRPTLFQSDQVQALREKWYFAHQL
jgi:site-specific DNA-adenine methylase